MDEAKKNSKNNVSIIVEQNRLKGQVILFLTLTLLTAYWVYHIVMKTLQIIVVQPFFLEIT